MPEFSVCLFVGRHRLPHFRPDQFTKAAPQAMNDRFGRRHREPQLGRRFRQGDFAPLSIEKALQDLETPGFLIRLTLAAQLPHHSIEQRVRPHAIISLIGSRLIDQLASQTRLGLLFIEGKKKRTTTALQPLTALPFMSEKVIQAAQHKGSEAPALHIGPRQHARLDEPQKKALHQILRILRWMPQPAHISKQRKPIPFA